MAFVAFEPVGNVLDIGSLILHGDGFFNRNDVHAYTTAAHGDHRSNLLKRKEGHALKKHGQFRVFVHQGYVHVGILSAAGDEHGHPIDAVLAFICCSRNGAFLGVLVSVVILQHAKDGQFVQKFVQTGIVRRVMLLGVHFMEQGIRMMLANLEEVAGKHVQEQVKGGFAGYGVHLVLKDAGKAPVFRSVGVHLYLAGHTVRDVADEFKELGIGVFVAKVLGDKLL